MQCPRCGSESKQNVEDTRVESDGRIRRRRRCSSCRDHYTTIEQISERSLRVRKSNGSVVSFDAELVRKGIKRSTPRKYKHPSHELDELVDQVFTAAYAASTAGVIGSAQVGDIVLEVLKQSDKATHIRFALVHLGRRDREDERLGWVDADDLRAWLLEEYPDLEYWRPPAKLVNVVKRSGDRQPFDQKKLERSIGYASKGCGSPEEVHQLATNVAKDVARALGDQPLVASGQIAAEILRSLRDHEPIAYLRYASSTKRFTDPKDFEAEACAVRHRTLRRAASTHDPSRT